MRSDDPADLEFTPDQMRAMTDAVMDRVIEHLASIRDQPVRGEVDTPEACRAMREPVRSDALGPLLDQLFDEWIPAPTTPQAGYFATFRAAASRPQSRT